MIDAPSQDIKWQETEILSHSCPSQNFSLSCFPPPHSAVHGVHGPQTTATIQLHPTHFLVSQLYGIETFVTKYINFNICASKRGDSINTLCITYTRARDWEWRQKVETVVELEQKNKIEEQYQMQHLPGIQGQRGEQHKP